MLVVIHLGDNNDNIFDTIIVKDKKAIEKSIVRLVEQSYGQGEISRKIKELLNV